MIEEGVYEPLLKIGLSLGLGLLIGLEREWAHKEAGVRTFTLLCILGSLFSFISREMVVIGGVFVIGMSAYLSFLGLQKGEVRLTTITSLMITYGVGVTVGYGLYIPSILIAVVTMTLLATKRELHEIAGELSEEELRAIIKFAIVAFIVLPVLPNRYVDPWGVVNPRVVWLMVVLITGLSLLNYVLLKKFGGRGITYLAFFGGLLNSTAVVGEISHRVRNLPELKDIAIPAVFLADFAMVLRNMALVAILSLSILKLVILPMVVMIITAYAMSKVFYRNIGGDLSIEIRSPVSLWNSFKFGVIFLIIILFAYFANYFFGGSGFVISEFVSGLISSESATIGALLLFLSQTIDAEIIAIGIVMASIASILVKLPIIFVSRQKDFIFRVATGDVLVLITGMISGALAFQFF